MISIALITFCWGFAFFAVFRACLASLRNWVEELVVGLAVLTLRDEVPCFYCLMLVIAFGATLGD